MDNYNNDFGVNFPPTPDTKKKMHKLCDHCEHYSDQWSISINGGSYINKQFVAPSVVELFNAHEKYSTPAVVTISSSYGGPSIRYRKNW
ncbi:hypothetical protein LCGC14_2638870 [marine sediment metagenome]|uniref:Uncharacterized protein n=1 Tax=marine sediment metagenome TaxID=412755 RepID=A0A0F9CQE2_9ZZZZ